MTSLPDRKLLLAVCLLLGLLLCIGGCISVMPYINLKGNPNGNPVRILIITMDVNQREEFFTQMRNFADKHDLKFTVSFYDAHKKIFLVEMNGDGFHITAGDTPHTTPTDVNIGFYNEASPPTTQETFDELYNDLKSFLGEIPNVAIKEKLMSLRITVDKNQYEELLTEIFTQLQKFADKRSLEFTASFYNDERYEIFVVTIYGDGFQITSEAVRGNLTEIIINFYVEFNNKAPTLTSQETADELFNDLKSFLGEIPNVTIMEEK
jgi:hypothetical protein